MAELPKEGFFGVLGFLILSSKRSRFMNIIKSRIRNNLASRNLMPNFCLFGLIFTLGCAAHIAPMDDKFLNEKFGFLRVGETTRQEVQSRLGDTFTEYEHGTIITYWINEGRNKELYVASGGSRIIGIFKEYNLVLVFGESGVLERFSLIQKK